MVSFLRSFVLIFLILYFKKEKNVESEEEKTEKKKLVREITMEWKFSFENGLFLKKEGDKKGHVFELLFSDGLYNCARGGEGRSIFRYKSLNVFVLENKVTTR